MQKPGRWQSMPSLVLGILFGLILNPITIYVCYSLIKEAWRPAEYFSTAWIIMAFPASITGIVLAALGTGKVKAGDRRDWKAIAGLILNILAAVSFALLVFYLLGTID